MSTSNSKTVSPQEWLSLTPPQAAATTPSPKEETPKTARENIFNPDDISYNVVMNYFLAQLRQYLEKTKPN